MDSRQARGLEVLRVPGEYWRCVLLSSDPPLCLRTATRANAPQGQDGFCSAKVEIWVMPTLWRCSKHWVFSSLTKLPASVGLLSLACPELAHSGLSSLSMLVYLPASLPCGTTVSPGDPDQPLSHFKAYQPHHSPGNKDVGVFGGRRERGLGMLPEGGSSSVQPQLTPPERRIMGNMGAVFTCEVSMNPHPSCHNHIATNKENGFDISSWPAVVSVGRHFIRRN